MRYLRCFVSLLCLSFILVAPLHGASLLVSEDTYSIQDVRGKDVITRFSNGGPTLNVEGKSRAYLYFDLTEVNAARPIRSARLRFFFSSVMRPGAGIGVHAAQGIWKEAETRLVPAPSVGSERLALIEPVDIASKQFASVDVTSVVQGWVTNPSSNHGFALVAVSGSGAGVSARIASKEGSLMGVPAMLDIEFGESADVV